MTSINFFKLSPLSPQKEQEVFSKLGNILNEDDHKYIAVQDWNGNDIMFSFLPEYKVNQLILLFKEYNVLDTHRNITDDVLMSREKSEDFNKMFKDESYKNLLNNFLKSNLTPDMILDKINEQGISSLTELDKEILS